MSPRLRRVEQRAATRHALLDAAAEVFAAQGLHGAAIEEVCERAGFSRGAFYSNFSSKRQLFLEVLDRHTAQAMSRIAVAFEHGANLQERVTNGARAAEEVIAHDRTWCQLYYEGWVAASRDETFRALYAQRYHDTRELLTGMLDSEIADRHPDTDSDELAAAILAMFEGYALQRIIDPQALPDGFLARGLKLLLSSL